MWRGVTTAAAVLGTLTLGLSASGSAYAHAGSAAGSQERLVAAQLALSPTDSQLTAATDEQLIDLAIRCVPIAELTYCVHSGWETQSADPTAAVRSRAKATAAASASASSATPVSTSDSASASASRGDTDQVTALRTWAALPRATRIASESAEIAEARAAVGKVLLFEHVIHGRPLPDDFAARYPADAPLAERLLASAPEPSGLTAAATSDVVAPQAVGNCDNGTNTGCAYVAMSTSRMQKQTTYYNCGAASMQAIAWNDPKASLYKSQSAWESILGTTPANGTYVGNLKSAINSYTHWDDSDYAGAYVVVSISSWTVSNFRSLFINHIRTLRAPVQLHPVLNSSTSTYYPGTTGGHYNVAIGYDYSVGDWVEVYEPAGGAPQSNVYPALTAWDDTTHIRLAQRANSNQNIVY